MKNLQEATERICELKGSLVALDALVPSLVDALSASARARLLESFDAHSEAARTVLLHADVSDVVLSTFERDVARNRAVLQHSEKRDPARTPAGSVETLLLTTTRIGSGDRHEGCVRQRQTRDARPVTEAAHEECAVPPPASTDVTTLAQAVRRPGRNIEHVRARCRSAHELSAVG